MIEENERAAKFMQAIQRDGEKRRTAIIYGLGGVIAPFIGIKLIDMVLAATGLF